MKIRKQKNIHVCNNIDEVAEILNFSYKTLRFKDINWYNSNKSSIGTVEVPFSFVEGMTYLLGETIYGFRAECYEFIRIIPDEQKYGTWSFSLEMFEEYNDFIIQNQ